jgi:very-short-patch-repair endonuclease
LEGPVKLKEAPRYGLTRGRLRGSNWKRLGAGFYALTSLAQDPIVVLAAAASQLPASGVFSHATAAWLHGLDFSPCDPIEVTLPASSGRSHISGVSIKRSDLADGEATQIGGFPVTTPIRTLADLARRATLVEGVVALDTALHNKKVALDDLHQWADAHPKYRGAGRLQKALHLAEPLTESPMETRLRMLLVLAGLPKPKVQVSLYDEDGFFVARPDLYYPDKRLAIEYDGGTHRNSLAADNRRQNALLDAGYRLLRFTASDIFQTPLAVVSLVRRTLAV